MERGQERERGPAHGLAHKPAPGEEWGRKAGHDPWAERQASRNNNKERLGRITGREEVTRHAQEGPQHGPTASLSAHGLGGHDQHRSLGREAIRERLEALRDRTRPGVSREEPATGLPALGREPERAHEAQRARSSEAIREQLRGVLDRAKPVAVEREGPSHERGREGQAHKERAHGHERERIRHRERDDGWDHGL